MRKRFIALVLVVIFLSTMLVGCGGKDTVVGKWKSTVSRRELTFSENGKLLFKEGGLEDLEEYEILSDSEIAIGDGFDNPEIVDYYFDDGDLVLGDERYEKAK